MSVTDYSTIREYVESATSVKARIAAIDVLIDAMILNMADAVDNSGTASFRLDDGQMNINTEFRTVEDVQKGVKSLESMKQMYINRINGRTVVFRGRSNY